MNKLRWRIYIVWLSLKWVFKINLGDKVWHHGKKYVVVNGVRSGMWRLTQLGEFHYFENDNDGWVKRDKCKKVLTFPNMYGSFKSGYRFYMTSWYDIWVREGISGWMKKLNIWGKEQTK